MQLILWRHADAEMSAPDKSRHLSALGVEQARGMAAWLKPRLPENLRILVSPALRTRETADALQMNYVMTNELYTETDSDALLRLAAWPEGASDVLLIGHQPMLGELAARVVTGQAHAWDIDKASVWWFESRRVPGHATVKAVLSPALL